MRSIIAWTGALLVHAAIFLIPFQVLAARTSPHQRLQSPLCQVGQCFDMVHRRRTGQACGPGLPQCGPHQMCDRHARRGSCALPGIDTAAPTPVAKPCNADACGGPCAVPLPCPFVVSCPEIIGECVADSTGGCACHPLPTPTEGPPLPTPTPPCGGAVCGGPCLLPFRSCPPGAMCDGPKAPEIPPIVGQCTLTAAGDCACAPPATPAPGSPTPTATPQCGGAMCGGPCLIGGAPIPCPPDAPCAEPAVLLGQCEVSPNGNCECMPVKSTPLPTPPPQCSDGMCSGSCVVPVPCGSDECPAIAVRGECQLTPAGACACVPVNLVTPAPAPTIPTECDVAACGGLCVIRFCPPGALCPDLLGHCDFDASGACTCMPGGAPTPTPPPPQCASLPCGGKCAILPPCKPGGACPQYAILGSCQVVNDGCTCVAGNGTPPPSPTTGGCGLSCDGRPCTGMCADGTLGMGTCANLSDEQGCTCALDCAQPTPTPTPCEHCLPHGHTCCECPDRALACFDFSWVEVERVCPQDCKTFVDAQCAAPCGPGPATGPAHCVSQKPTPCVVDQDCDDENGCTLDRCTAGGCVHECVCL